MRYKSKSGQFFSVMGGKKLPTFIIIIEILTTVYLNIININMSKHLLLLKIRLFSEISENYKISAY